MTGRPAHAAPVVLVAGLLYACAAPLKTDAVSFRPPSDYPNTVQVDGLTLAVVPIDDVERSTAIFGTDMREADVLPVQIIAENNGRKEFEIDSRQIFGIREDGHLTAAYTLDQSAQHTRQSSIGTTAATSAALGAIAGAAAGAAIGAAAGEAAGGDAGSGAAAGAAIGGAAGATTGTAAGLSDRITVRFKKELAAVSFGDRVIYPGDIQQGFVYLKWDRYSRIRVKLFNITDSESRALSFDVALAR